MPSQPSSLEKQRDEFLAEAEDAERHAAAAIDSVQKAGWMKIAADYRDLALRIDVRLATEQRLNKGG
jgi:hypothetical protein